MIHPIAVTVVCFFILGLSEGDYSVKGVVLDEQGKPVAQALVGYLWSANGGWRDKDGKLINPSDPKALANVWGHLGDMYPIGIGAKSKSDENGAFTINVPKIYRSLMAVDATGANGGIVLLPQSNPLHSLKIHLAPMVKVEGSFIPRQQGRKLGWTHVYVKLPPDPERPIDSDRLVSCGSYDAKFAFSLPPGEYHLNAYNEKSDAILSPDKKIVLTKGMRELKLGEVVLDYSPVADFYDRIAAAKRKGS